MMVAQFRHRNAYGARHDRAYNKTMNIKPTHDVQQNIFGFAEPDRLTCQIQEYHLVHSLLTIEVMGKPTKNILYSSHITFAMLYYFSGPSHWHGANFEL